MRVESFDCNVTDDFNVSLSTYVKKLGRTVCNPDDHTSDPPMENKFDSCLLTKQADFVDTHEAIMKN